MDGAKAILHRIKAHWPTQFLSSLKNDKEKEAVISHFRDELSKLPRKAAIRAWEKVKQRPYAPDAGLFLYYSNAEHDYKEMFHRASIITHIIDPIEVAGSVARLDKITYHSARKFGWSDLRDIPWTHADRRWTLIVDQMSKLDDLEELTEPPKAPVAVIPKLLTKEDIARQKEKGRRHMEAIRNLLTAEKLEPQLKLI